MKTKMGERYGALTVVRFVGQEHGQNLWECVCDCGKTVILSARQLARRTNCGCKLRDELRKRVRRLVDWEHRPEPTTCKGFGPCLIWTARVDANGRAQMTVGTKTKRASHVVWFIAHGVWPQYLCHRCDNPRCVAIEHLFEGDAAINGYDRRRKEQGGVMVP